MGTTILNYVGIEFYDPEDNVLSTGAEYFIYVSNTLLGINSGPSSTWSCPKTTIQKNDYIKIIITLNVDWEYSLGSVDTSTAQTTALNADILDSAIWSGFNPVISFIHSAYINDGAITNISYSNLAPLDRTLLRSKILTDGLSVQHSRFNLLTDGYKILSILKRVRKKFNQFFNRFNGGVN